MTESLADRVLARAKRILEVGSEAADVLVHMQHGPTPVGIAAVGMRVVNSIRQHRAKSPEEHFARWKPLDLGKLRSDALVALRTDETVTCEEVDSMHEHSPALITHVDDMQIGWEISGTLKNPKADVVKAWIPPDASATPVYRRLGRALWTNLRNTRGVIICDDEREGRVHIHLVAEDDEKIFPSARGREMSDRINKFKERGYNRSFFIIGEAGIGKTCMLRYIASLQGGFRLRFPLGELEDVRAKSLVRIVQILRPDVLIIDDLDRYVKADRAYRDDESKATPEAAAMLDPLDVFDKIVPLVLVSANYSESITDAVLRPGRFAELEIIEDLDADLYRQMLPDAPEKLIKALKRESVPIVYVEELKKRIDALGYEEAAKEMKDLVARSNRILQLNKRKTKKRKTGASLRGTTPLQRAAILERRAASSDREAARYQERAAKLKEKAEDQRVRAEAERKKPPKKAKAKAKTARAPKKKPPTSKSAEPSKVIHIENPQRKEA